MKKLVLLAGAILLTACSAITSHPAFHDDNYYQKSAEVTRIYDRNGNLVGTMDEKSGRVYSKTGRYLGRKK